MTSVLPLVPKPTAPPMFTFIPPASHRVVRPRPGILIPPMAMEVSSVRFPPIPPLLPVVALAIPMAVALLTERAPLMETIPLLAKELSLFLAAAHPRPLVLRVCSAIPIPLEENLPEVVLMDMPGLDLFPMQKMSIVLFPVALEMTPRPEIISRLLPILLGQALLLSAALTLERSPLLFTPVTIILLPRTLLDAECLTTR